MKEGEEGVSLQGKMQWKREKTKCGLMRKKTKCLC